MPKAPPVNIITLPKEYDGKSELPVVVMLHGMYSKPASFLGQEFEDIADELKAVVVAASGPMVNKDGHYFWSDNINENLVRIEAAVADASQKAKLRKDQVVLLGYSQGAYAALGLGYAHPEVFAGVIAISPGSLSNPALPASQSTLLVKRGFVLCYGGKDDAQYIRQGNERLEAARRAGAKVEIKVYPNAEHLIPEDRDEFFPKWFEFVMRANEG